MMVVVMVMVVVVVVVVVLHPPAEVGSPSSQNVSRFSGLHTKSSCHYHIIASLNGLHFLAMLSSAVLLKACWQIRGMFFKAFSQSSLVCITAGIVFVPIFTLSSSPCISTVSFLRSLKRLFCWCGCVVRSCCWYVQALDLV